MSLTRTSPRPARTAPGPLRARLRARCRRVAPVAGIAVAALVLAACGSNLDPSQMVGAGAGVPGAPVTAADGTVTDGGVVPDGSVPELGDVDNGGLPVSPGDPGAAPGGDGSDGSGGTDAPEEGGGGSGDADGGVKAASCDGFDNNQPGVTADTITLANASDLSGPVPGIFEAAQLGARAFIEYYNSTESLCGHKLVLKNLDTRADAGADQQAYATACAQTFAAVGSMSAFDSGGAATAQSCGIPDVRSTTVTPNRSKCSTCFAAQSVSANLVPASLPKYWVAKEREASQHVALLYINAGAAVVNAQSFNKAYQMGGMKIDYFQGIDVAEFNFAPYVQQMKDRGIQMVMYLGPYQNTVKLQQAMAQQGFEPKVYLQDATIQDQGYIDQAGSLGEGSYVYSTTELFDSNNAEMKLYRSWLNQVSPGADPNFYGVYAWSAARLFVQQATALGGKLTRESLVQSLKGVKGWTANGLHAPQTIGSKATTPCVRIVQLSGGRFKQVSSGAYQCGALINSGIGG